MALSNLRRLSRPGSDRGDLLYRTYVTGLIGVVCFYFLLGLIDGAAVSPATVARIATVGPRWLELAAAIGVAAGIRSGANGGPLAIEEVEFQHVLLSPVSRAVALRKPFHRLIGIYGVVGAVVGAGAGELAHRQLPGGHVQWVLSGLLTGMGLTLGSVGAAMAASTIRIGRKLATGLSVSAVTWASADFFFGYGTSPFSALGSLGFWALNHGPTALLGLVLPYLPVLVGIARVQSLSIEQAHRRSRLVAQIRFALARHDLRMLLLLRRQLNIESPRTRPWFTVRFSRLDRLNPTVVRDFRSYARWPLARILRVATLTVVAGLALASLWQGTTAMLLVAGGAVYLEALEVIEPLSQEFDHPSISELVPVAGGRIVASHVVSAATVLAVLWFLAGAVASSVVFDWRLIVASSAAAGPAGLAAAVAAGLSIRRLDAPSLTGMMPEELVGMQLLVRLGWPPALTAAGALPILAFRRALTQGAPSLPALVRSGAAVLVVASLCFAWLRYRDQIQESAAQRS